MRAFIKYILVCAAFIFPYPLVKAHIYTPIFELRVMNVLDGIEPFPYAFDVIGFAISFPFAFIASCLLICLVFWIELLIWGEADQAEDERLRLMELKREIKPNSFRVNRWREIESVKAETLAVRYPVKFYELMDRVTNEKNVFAKRVLGEYAKSAPLSKQHLELLDIAIKHETYERVYGN